MNELEKKIMLISDKIIEENGIEDKIGYGDAFHSGMIYTMEELKEKIEGMELEIPEGDVLDQFNNDGQRKIYNEALQDILKLLE